MSLLYKSLLAALAALLLTASGASAFPTTVRVEAPTAAGGLVPRVAVDLDPNATITRPGTAGDVQCAGDSPIAALDQATGGAWSGTGADASSFAVTKIKNGLDTSMILVNAPSWVAYIGAARSASPCTDHVKANTEVLFYPLCATTRRANNCWTAEPMGAHLFDTGNYATAAESVTFGSPLAIYAVQANNGQWGSTSTALISTDEGTPPIVSNATLRGDGIGFVNLQNAGPHTITVNAQDGSAPPSRLPVCSTDGGDGWCGTIKDAPPPFVVTNYPSDCQTNGHDGNCGTPDTSGPVATVTNIKDKQVFKKKHGPGQVKGTLSLDPNGVGGLKMRLTRTVRTKVKVKVKSKHKTKKGRRAKVRYRYRTVTRCTQWNDATALLQSMRKCGTKYGTWFPGELGDPVSTFSYSFAMTLPAGSYVLEVQASDENRYIDAPAPGRNVIRFTVQ
jgi:hypothetical protein